MFRHHYVEVYPNTPVEHFYLRISSNIFEKNKNDALIIIKSRGIFSFSNPLYSITNKIPAIGVCKINLNANFPGAWSKICKNRIQTDLARGNRIHTHTHTHIPTPYHPHASPHPTHTIKNVSYIDV